MRSERRERGGTKVAGGARWEWGGGSRELGKGGGEGWSGEDVVRTGG